MADIEACTEEELNQLLDDFADVLFSMWSDEMKDKDATISHTTICKNPQQGASSTRG